MDPLEYPDLRQAVIELNDHRELMKVFGWTEEPILDRPGLGDFEYVEDVNERRLRDAESLGTVARNTRPGTIVEIGTADGMGTLLMAVNAPQARVHTVNIPPEEIASGAGGKLTTVAMEREKIGIAFRERDLPNIVQILANTATWKPDVGPVDLAYIDGCHDSDFVYNDTRKLLRHMGPGAFILWHDFHPGLAYAYPWIASVCRGVDRLFRDELLRGRIFHIRDSWVGVHRLEQY